MEPVFFADQFAFRKWLEQYHDKQNELLVGFYKAGSGKQNMTWPESVDQALCFGWIDGIRRSVDKESYCIRFTPRRRGSTWSAVNISKIEKLNREGLMHPAGLKRFSERKINKSAIYSYENNPVPLPDDLEKQFKGNKKAWSFFCSQSPSYRKNVCRWIMDAKQEPTRHRRLDNVIKASEEARRLF